MKNGLIDLDAETGVKTDEQVIREVFGTTDQQAAIFLLASAYSGGIGQQQISDAEITFADDPEQLATFLAQEAEFNNFVASKASLFD